MRICVLSEYFYPDTTGGTGTVMSGLVRHLHDHYQDVEIDVVTSQNIFRGETGQLPARENWGGVQIRRVASPVASKNSTRRRLLSNLLFTGASLRAMLTSRRKYDMVLVVTAPPTLPLAARIYGALTGTPYVYLVHDLFLDMAVAMNLLSSQSRSTQLMRSVQRRWFEAASKVVVLGRCMRELVGKRYRIESDKMEVIPIPANLQQIKVLDHDTRFRAEHGLSDFVVLYAGNFARYQDFDTLLDAAARLRDRENITFVFVGDGARRGHIETRVRNESLDNVRLLPFVPEAQLNDLLASASVSLVTLEKEIAGLAVPSKFYNILASGRPAVAVVDPQSEIGHTVREAQCGVQIDPEDAAGLEAELRRLADAPRRVEEMGHNARAVCEAKFSRDHVCHQFYQVFEQVVAGRRRQSTRPQEAPAPYRAKAEQSALK